MADPGLVLLPVFKKVQFLLALWQMGARVNGEKLKVVFDLFLGGRGNSGRPVLTLQRLLLNQGLLRLKVIQCYI